MAAPGLSRIKERRTQKIILRAWMPPLASLESQEIMDTPCHPRGRERTTALSSLEGERGGPPLAYLKGGKGHLEK